MTTAAIRDRLSEYIRIADDQKVKAMYVLEEHPAKGMQRHTTYREAIVKVFPFLIIYRIEDADNCIFVHSIFHAHRNPRKKYRK